MVLAIGAAARTIANQVVECMVIDHANSEERKKELAVFSERMDGWRGNFREERKMEKPKEKLTTSEGPLAKKSKTPDTIQTNGFLSLSFK